MAKIISSRLSRTALLASVATAGLCLGTAGQLRAQTMGPALNSGLTSEYREAQGGSASASGITGDYLEPQRDYIGAVKADPQVLIADPNTPVTAQDPTNITGVGQMVADIGGGFIGLCTGTLINPRTVIFAAHCVNENAATDYGSPSGGIPIGFGFQQDNLPATRDWFLPGPGQYMTNIANAFYNSNYVAYHPGSLEPESAGFLYSDVAVASLDTPASNIPTWALLFSALPDPGEIGAEGTGYHVTIDGYGRNGTGSTGASASVDFRRRIAENIVGSLASLDDFELFLFYGLRTSDGYTEGLPQNLYWIDFDDPKRGTPDASPFDFNAWRDNALPNEGITSSGDSGGPLILDQTFDSPVVIGVLSGGYSRFFNGQPTNGYGTASFYQPLYLYWDWIAANNPYHYVTAKAGDGDWSDPDHWLTMLDPNYKIIDANGNLVNGVPTAPGAGNTDQPGFGQVCYQAGGLSDCYDVSTGDEIFDVRPIGTSDLSNDRDVVSATALGDGTGSTSGSTTTTAAADEEPTLPAATLANGLPGASGFVPDDYDGDRTIGEAPRYFDVTLSAAGTTTLSDRVTVDRLTMSGMGAALDIKAGGSLTSLIDINQLSGMIRVDGTLKTFGDYFLMSGGLQGSGVISTPYFTNVAGVIAPGGVGGIGSLRFYGDVILSSASTLLIDLGANGVSDRINVSATTFEEEGDGIMTAAVGDPTNGIASLGGQVAFGATAGTKLRAGSSYTFLIAEGGITGSFDSTSPTAISAILKPVLSYTANSVKVTIKAGFYRNVIDSTSPVQVAYATLLDQNQIGRAHV